MQETGKSAQLTAEGAGSKDVEEVKEVKGVKEIRNQSSRELPLCLAEGQSVA